MWQEVVTISFRSNPTGGPGGSRIETLACGHKWVGKMSQKEAMRRRCDQCPRDAHNNPGPTTGIPKKRRKR